MAGKAGKRVYGTRAWKAARRVALARAEWKCENCGRMGRLEVHHKRRIVDAGDWFRQDNLMVLCRPCHFAEHKPPGLRELNTYMEGLIGAETE